MAAQINADLQNRDAHAKDIINDAVAIDHVVRGVLPKDQMDKICALPVYLFVYKGDSLLFWNNNALVSTPRDSVAGAIALFHNRNGVYLRRVVQHNGFTVIGLSPIQITYPMENDYLHSHFVASDNIPESTQILSTKPATLGNYYPIIIDNKVVGYVAFSMGDLQKWTPDINMIVLLVAAILTALAWLQLMAVHLNRNRSPLVSFAMLFSVIMALRIATYIWGMPFHLDALTLFSPLLYASSKLLPSLGDLIVNILLVLWVVVFIARHTSYRTFFTHKLSLVARWAYAVLFSVAITALLVFMLGQIKSLIRDSTISFDVTHVSTLSMFSVMGLVTILIMGTITFTVFYLINIQLNALLRSKPLKYIVVAAVYLILSYTVPYFRTELVWYALFFLLAFLILTDIPHFGLSSRLLEPHMMVWAFLLCLACTGLTRFYNTIKELDTRRAYVDQHLSPRRDDVMEYYFDEKAKNIASSSEIKAFFKLPSPEIRLQIGKLIDSQYLNAGPLNKYQLKVYLFDAAGYGLYNKDSVDFLRLNNDLKEASSTNSSYLFYKEAILDRHYYIGSIPVYSSEVNKVIGYVVVDMELKKAATETVYPELLQPASGRSSNTVDYATAVYVNGQLIAQTGEYAFKVSILDTLPERQYIYVDNKGVKELVYKVTDRRTVIVVHHHNKIIEAVTLFSYLFGLEIAIAIVILLYQLFLSYFAKTSFDKKYIRLTLRRRVHLSMLVVVFLSFVIIGFVTIQFFVTEYRDTNNEKLNVALQFTRHGVTDFLQSQQGLYNQAYFDYSAHSVPFKSFLSKIAAEQKVDINIFDAGGNLVTTSQDEIFSRGLLSDKMRQEAFYELKYIRSSLVVHNEKVANLEYISAYQPIRNDEGATLGYINIPFFTSEKDLDYQISNIVVTLINLYAFIFLLSSILTLFVTKWITRTFDIIIKQFDKLNLEQNERIVWPYEDEIGKLVNEYNKMVAKVEDNALRLAQSERETAWREMARQVAHEIKNPLTPMKLNIQYLQQAMRNDNPNIKQLTDRVSASIIEQIDNLSYIASEFSNFAKMPEAKAEEIDMVLLLNKMTQLYINDTVVKVTLDYTGDGYIVLADKSQLLRVFTNLLENAKQAIPEDKQGIIQVSMTKDAEGMLIAIGDNGSGINEEVAKRIFQPYFTTKSSGTGLGLAMTKKIIEFWKGKIWFDTEEHVGTTFYVRLPLLTE